VPEEDSVRGGPRWERDSTAWGASLLVHLLMLGALAVLSLSVPRRTLDLQLDLEPVDLAEIEPLSEEFFAAEELPDEMGALGDAAGGEALASAVEYSERSVVAVLPDSVAEIGEMPTPLLDMEVLQGPEISDRLPVQGVGSEGLRSAAGAIDRITQEIVWSLEQGPTLVVWLFDQSGSLRDQRRQILQRFHRIYDELGVLEAAQNPAFRRQKDKPLLTAVWGFGQTTRRYTDKPTDDIGQITSAIEAIEDDESGQENVFHAILDAAEGHRSFQAPSQGKRRVMIVVFTDEAGDDLQGVDVTVSQCRKLATPVYVVGPPAPFGRDVAYVKWIDPDPEFDQRPQWVPVSLGPESMAPERLRLKFSGDDDQLLDSGFGPYALTRLCYETGGLYFATHPNRVVGRTVSAGEIVNLSTHFSQFFDEDAMRPYQPDYLSAREYQKLLVENRARTALVEAARLSWTAPMEDVPMRFPKRDEAELAQTLGLAQRNAALLQPKIDRLCHVLLAGEDDRPALKGLRWQAGFDLAVGRALAVQVRTEGYNAMLAQAKQGLAFQKNGSNTWILRPAAEYASSSLERAAAKSLEYLERVADEHDGTPWGMLAQRELKSPLGWRWDEGFTPLP
ncbi:MAG: VWA domain-containing protein, partial [Planctomycetales bacterium]|nr:VWA domain-containing protein [Planctomycetales bacterium]